MHIMGYHYYLTLSKVSTHFRLMVLCFHEFEFDGYLGSFILHKRPNFVVLVFELYQSLSFSC